MQSLQSSLKGYKVKQSKSKRPTSEWQELGKEISEYFGRPLYWMIAPWKDHCSAVRMAFKETKERGKSWQYLAAILKLKSIR